jgi:hypothetical protein
LFFLFKKHYSSLEAGSEDLTRSKEAFGLLASAPLSAKPFVIALLSDNSHCHLAPSQLRAESGFFSVYPCLGLRLLRPVVLPLHYPSSKIIMAHSVGIEPTKQAFGVLAAPSAPCLFPLYLSPISDTDRLSPDIFLSF